jgi:hypothetical protein
VRGEQFDAPQPFGAQPQLTVRPHCRVVGESTVKKLAISIALLLSGCGTVPWMPGPEVSEAACTASCNAHFDQCPQIFAGFPERGAVECPAEHNNCLRMCEKHHAVARAAAPSPSPQVMPGTVRAVSSKEARLRELKHLYDEGLVTDDVYKDRQKAILSEP